MGRRAIFTPPPGFFEALDGSALPPGYDLTLKAASECILRIDARHEEARGHDAREGGVSDNFFRHDRLRNITATADGRGA